MLDVVGDSDIILGMKCYLKRGLFDRWFIVHPTDDNLAWSGSRWVAHDNGLPTGGVQICNFTTEDEAYEYAKRYFTVITMDFN